MRGNGFVKVALVGIGIGFLVVCFVIAILTYLDLRTEWKLDNEIESIETVLNQDKLDEAKLTELLSREVMKGTYEKVEKAYKDNVSNIMILIKEMDIFDNSLDLVNAFSSDNIKNDGPDFEETKKRIEDYQKEYDEKSKELIKIKEDETLWSYLPEKRNSKYNRQYLKENIKKVFRMKYLKNILADFSKTKNILDQASKMVDFLEKNKEDWKVKEDNVVFKTDSLQEEYQKLYSKWQELIEIKEVEIKTGE